MENNENTMQKEAMATRLPASSLTHKAVNAILLPTLALGAAGAFTDSVVKPIRRSRQISASKRQLRDYHPDLANVDDKTIDDYFSVVKTYSPAAAKNPIVAGDLVSKMVQFGGVDHNLVKGMVDIEKGVHDLERSVGTDMLASAGGKGLGGAIGEHLVHVAP